MKESSPPNLRKRAIIFDMDGVLVESEPLHLRAFQAVLKGYGIEHTVDAHRALLGRKDRDGALELIERYQLSLPVEQFLAEKEAVLHQLFKLEARPRPGAERVLAHCAAKKVPLAVASSATLQAIDLIMEILSFKPFFQTLTSGEEVENGKPAPDIFLLASERLQIANADCLVIEDSLNGILAAKAAGMKCLAIPCDATRHQDHSPADWRMHSLLDFDVDTWLAKGSL